MRWSRDGREMDGSDTTLNTRRIPADRILSLNFINKEVQNVSE
jgi:hypothetical protein